MRRLGVAVIGLGVGEAHARAYAAHPAAELRALHDLDYGKAKSIASSLGADAAGSYDAILDDPRIDVVSIATYDDAHHKQALAALAAGKHVLVEKPICQTPRELRELKAAVERSGKQLSSNMLLRGAPLYVWLKSAITQGQLGRTYAMDADYLYGRVEKITHGWRRAIPDYSVMVGGGVHMVDLLMWLRGARVTTVQAVGSRIATADTEFRYDDHTSAHLTFADGVVARVTANFACVHPHQHVVRVFGTGGTFLYDDAGPRLHRSRAKGAPVEALPHAPKPTEKGVMIHRFIEALRDGEDLSGHTQGIFDAMSVCFAIDRAKAAKIPQEVEYV